MASFPRPLECPACGQACLAMRQHSIDQTSGYKEIMVGFVCSKCGHNNELRLLCEGNLPTIIQWMRYVAVPKDKKVVRSGYVLELSP
jgi:C4-type Zn-finger protein